MEEDGEDGSHSGDVELPVNHVREVIFHIRLAAPVCMGMLCNRFIAAVSVAFVGRLGPELLAAAALATTISNVTGNSVMVGLSGATNTLAGQAFGAGYFMEVGLVMQRGLCIVTCGLIPITAMWFVATPSLEFIGISPQLSARAGEYLVYLIPGLWGYAGKLAVQNYLHAQKHTTPTAIAGVGSALIHIPMNILLMDYLGFGYLGAAIAYSLSHVITLILLIIYIFVMGLHKKTWPGFSSQALKGWGPYLQLALPGVLMLSEWWASETNIFMSGYLPDSDQQVATMAIYQTTIGLAFMIPVGIGVATNIRVATSIGANNLARAKRAAITGPLLCLLVTGLECAGTLVVRKSYGSMFTDDAGLIHRVSLVLVVGAFYVIGDGVTCAFGGALQGCGRQFQAGWVVVFSYYVVGLPLAYYLAFVQDWQVMGLAAGLCTATYVHCAIYAVMVLTTSWDHQAVRAKARMTKSLSFSAGIKMTGLTTAKTITSDDQNIDVILPNEEKESLLLAQEEEEVWMAREEEGTPTV